MDNDDDNWLNFRERIINMGLVPDDDTIHFLEVLSGQAPQPVIKTCQCESTPIDKVCDKVEEWINHRNIKVRKISKKLNSYIKKVVN